MSASPTSGKPSAKTPPRVVMIASGDDAAPPAAGEADILLLDISGAVSGEEALAWAKPALDARQHGAAIWINAGGLVDERLEARLAALAPLRPDAFVLPAVASAADIQHLGAMLAVLEAEAGLDDRALRIVPCVETAPALFELSAIAKASPRLAALMWDGEAFARDLDAEEARGPDGRWTDPLQTVRTLVLAACADAGLPAVDSRFSGASDEAFSAETEAARRDGFAAKIALDAAQIAIVRRAFTARRD